MGVLDGLIPVFLLVGLGVAVRAWGLLPEGASIGLNRLVANVALPALLLLKVGSARLEASFSPAVMGVTTGLVVLTTSLVYLLAGAWRVPAAQRGVLAQAAIRGNLAYVAFPVILAARGEAGLQQAAVTAAVVIPVMNLLAVAVLKGASERGAPDGKLALRVFLNPIVAGSLAGLVLAAFSWHPWAWLAGTLQILADFALPGALLALGAQLRLGRWRGVWRPALVASVIKLVVLPAAGWWALRALGASGLELAVGVLLLAAPTAVASYPMAAELGGDRDLAGACVLATTAGGFPAYVIWTVVLSAG